RYCQKLDNDNYVYASSNTMSSIVLERTRYQKPLKNEYIEVQTNDEEINYGIKSRKQRFLDIINVQEERSLAVETIPPILISVIGLILAGWLFDTVQSWPVYTNVPELYILVPVLLNLKGNLEMNLASRLSTLANLGELNSISAQYTLIWGNLAVLQVQSLVVGAIAGIFSFIEGIIFNPNHMTSYYENNIACPMASSLGDLFTLIVLSLCSEFLFNFISSWVSTVMFLILAASVPLWASIVWTNKSVRHLLTNAWTPLFVAMVISSIAGLVLENYIDRYHGLAVLTPVLNGVIGNLGSIYASRISTRLHCGTEEDYYRSELTLFLINIPIEIFILIIAWWFDIGHMKLTWSFSITYFFVSVLCAAFTLIFAKKLTLWLWYHNYDPDNYSLPYITSVVDVVGNGLLVLSYWGLAKLIPA
ncbi:19625_t:CDS:10, partial [Gigaspora rosea]